MLEWNGQECDNLLVSYAPILFGSIKKPPPQSRNELSYSDNVTNTDSKTHCWSVLQERFF